MCGRFVFDITKDELEQSLPLEKPVPQLPLVYNVSPGMMLPVIIKDDFMRVVLMRWGLVPHWAKDPKIGYKMINARVETLNEKLAFRSLLQIKRCVIPARGFYEWKMEGKEKSPYYIHFQNDAPMFFAGLFDIWNDGEGRPLRTFTIITTKPNERLSSIHDRMPSILTTDDVHTWLTEGNSAESLKHIQTPFSLHTLVFHEVSRDVNSPSNDGKHLLQSV